MSALGLGRVKTSFGMPVLAAETLSRVSQAMMAAIRGGSFPHHVRVMAEEMQPCIRENGHEKPNSNSQCQCDPPALALIEA
jgi:hypothetical protein